ncbi:MAG: DUF4124 domain-containing protein [Gammaproteobacteria bacterium]
MNPVRIALLLITSLVWTSSSAEIYKWTDANGVVHYGDRPAQATAQRLPIVDRLPKPKPEPLAGKDGADGESAAPDGPDDKDPTKAPPDGTQPGQDEEPKEDQDGTNAEDTGDEASQPKEEEKKPTVYSAFAIASPANDGTVRSAPGSVSVSVNVTPPLDKDFKHSVRIRLDNKVVASGASTSFGLSNVDRGTHRLSAELLDENKRVLRRARTITFHLHR